MPTRCPCARSPSNTLTACACSTRARRPALRRSGYHQRWHPFLWTSRFELDAADELAAQLPARGLDPAGVRWIVLSHLHTDHVGNVAAFGQAEVVVTRVEWERAQGIRGHLRGYIPHRWPAGVRSSHGRLRRTRRRSVSELVRPRRRRIAGPRPASGPYTRTPGNARAGRRHERSARRRRRPFAC